MSTVPPIKDPEGRPQRRLRILHRHGAPMAGDPAGQPGHPARALTPDQPGVTGAASPGAKAAENR